MKQIFLALLIGMSFLGCSQEEADLTISYTTSTRNLIPAPAISCLSRMTAGSEPPAQDIEADYFTIPKITFNRKKTDKKLIISIIRISFGGEDAPVCIHAGDSLAALSAAWWAKVLTEPAEAASLPVGTATFSTDCELKCGGFKSSGGAFTATGVLEVFGYELDSSGNEFPIKLQNSVTIQSLF